MLAFARLLGEVTTLIHFGYLILRDAYSGAHFLCSKILLLLLLLEQLLLHLNYISSKIIRGHFAGHQCSELILFLLGLMIFNWVPLNRLFEDSSRFSHLIVLHRTAHDKDIKGANGRPLDCLLQLILLLLFLSDRRSCRFLGQVVIAGLRDVWRVTRHRLHPGAFSCWLVACVCEFFIVLRTSG